MFKPELPHHCTQSQPFSFEQRDKELKQKKEESIKAVILEEEKKVQCIPFETHFKDFSQDYKSWLFRLS